MSFSPPDPPSRRAPRAQVVVLGAGFDTRSIRYQREGLRFFEVDLPETIAAKRCVHNRYKAEVDTAARLPTLVGLNLNDCEHSSLLETIEGYGFKVREAARPLYPAPCPSRPGWPGTPALLAPTPPWPRASAPVGS